MAYNPFGRTKKGTQHDERQCKTNDIHHCVYDSLTGITRCKEQDGTENRTNARRPSCCKTKSHEKCTRIPCRFFSVVQSSLFHQCGYIDPSTHKKAHNNDENTGNALEQHP